MNTEMRPTDFFVAGGTLGPNAPSYVKRPADTELFGLTLAGKFCYVLTARQMGKSSLMIRTAQRLQRQGISTAIIDLTRFGTDVTVDQWYLGLVRRLVSQLKLSVESETWWAKRASLSVVDRFTEFLHDVVLDQIEGSVVVFVDEIDTTLNLDFSDDFFAAIRFTYNARADDPVYNRLTFVLLGVATPTDLITDPTRTPFNIGQPIDLREFTYEDAQVLHKGLESTCGEQGAVVFNRIFHWTNGHPYLTQKLCMAVAESQDGYWTNKHIDKLVEELFLSEKARKETNLRFVRDNISANPRKSNLLNLYRKVHKGKKIPEDERSFDQNLLKLFGLVRVEKGLLKVRNEIYRRAFDLDWIEANTPIDWTRRLAVASTLFALLLIGFIGFSVHQRRQQTTDARAQAFVDSFWSTSSSEVRITSLAGLFELSGYEDRAQRLFYEELGLEEQLALFDLDDPQTVGAQLITVVQGLYTDLTNDEQGNRLLRTMVQPLQEFADPMATNLATEIEQWLQGRAYHARGEYQQAVTAYDAAIRLNALNPGTYFDRAAAYIEMEKYDAALDDLEQVIHLKPEWKPRVRDVVENNSELLDYHGTHRDKYPDLSSFLPTLTPIPKSTNTVMPAYTLTPTLFLTHTPTPTDTPTPTLTIVPTLPPVTPQLSTPDLGSTYQNPIMFEWSGQLRAGQTYQVTAYHTDSRDAIRSDLLTVQRWESYLPDKHVGEWRWRVSVLQDGQTVASSSEWHFYFDPHPGGGGGNDSPLPEPSMSE